MKAIATRVLLLMVIGCGVLAAAGCTGNPNAVYYPSGEYHRGSESASDG
jgi:hypothetical protein